jgi:hypothetical protein
LLSKNERISINQFEKLADTGDILLFKYATFSIDRGKAAMSKVQRAFTGNEYDHVGLLLRYNDGSLFMFESTGQVGVVLTNWDKFIRNRWHTMYTKLVYRQLKIDRTDELVEQLENFIKVLDALYQVSFGQAI